MQRRSFLKSALAFIALPFVARAAKRVDVPAPVKTATQAANDLQWGEGWKCERIVLDDSVGDKIFEEWKSTVPNYAMIEEAQRQLKRSSDQFLIEVIEKHFG